MTPDLELQLAGTADLRYLAALANDPQVEPFLAPGVADEERLRASLAEAREAGDPSGLLVIRLRDGAPVGALTLRLVSRNSRIVELAQLMVSPDSRRAGIATAAVRLACELALRTHGMHRVQAETYGDNVAGQRVFERAGFTREGTRRRAYWRRGQWLDGALYGILAEEFTPARA
jgi:RimJ/RimL family protein N-acetyltransferase